MTFFKNYKFLVSFLFIPVVGVLISFNTRPDDEKKVQKTYKTEYVIVLIIDGPRMTETFGDSTYKYIPNLSGVLAPQGVLVKTFRNNGTTTTNSGHTAICTGVYQSVKNDGSELPKHPTMFQYFLKEKGLDSTQAWVIASKGKLNILANTKNKTWKNKYTPSQFCGVDGKGEGYTNDRNTWRDAQTILSKYHPKLTLINLLEVDVRGHQNEWPEYLQAIRNTDKIALDLWNFIQSDSIYKDKTTLLITNDHGRHLDGVKDGFVSHGGGCEGCRSIYLVALGPDFKSNTELLNCYEQIDISSTIAELLQFNYPISKGEVMTDLFK
jgi:hypothetical protein